VRRGSCSPAAGSISTSVPQVTLAAAREECNALHVGLQSGIDPSPTRRQAAALAQELELVPLPSGPRFTAIAEEWLASKRWGDDHAAKVRRSLERDVFPILGDRVVTTITRSTVADVLAKVMEREARETGSRIQQRIGEDSRLRDRERSARRQPRDPHTRRAPVRERFAGAAVLYRPVMLVLFLCLTLLHGSTRHDPMPRQ
jgi:hypothetical protein